ncbi:arginine--tRNA ligase [Adhaeribacter rhizoryzae]|uniref:Arginine--tRNA ligase n=1 Tax=Adhaeribacter rhizoryzae TaxID=2607907 RepID=A0A5M6DQ35_9BACT|nr:arginine--tRNA ligase [Adhaeribacter rhizoryzae]
MALEKKIAEAVSGALQTLFSVSLAAEEVNLQPTRKDFAGTFTFVTFPYTKTLGKGPEQIGNALGEYLKTNVPEVADYNVVKGFLNLVISDETWVGVFGNLFNEQTAETGKREKVVVEYSSPNTNKPLHLGHLRNNFLGYSVAEILKENGKDVVKVNLVNDRGIHICKSMVAYQLLGNGETPELAGIKGDHLAGKYYVAFDKIYKEQIGEMVVQGIEPDKAKKEAPIMQQAQQMLVQWEQGDEEVMNLWRTMNGWVYAGFDETYRTIGVDFDKFYYESETYLLGKDFVAEGLAQGIFFKKPDGSVWVDLKEEGLDEKLVLRADGTSVYITQDLGTAQLKYDDFKYDTSIYVIADEQNYHMQVLKSILQKMGKPYAQGILHLSYGMVDLPSGKMKSREGTVVDADELVAEMVETARQRTDELGKIEGLSELEAQQLYLTLAMGALKYFLLKVDPKKRMLFNPEESINFQGNTGPFIQYTHARIAAIMRKAAELGITAEVNRFENLTNLHETEAEVVALLASYPKVVAEAANLFAPSVIGQYAYDLAKAYNRFYTEVSIFQEINPAALAFRVALSGKVAEKIKNAMRLLGINVPDRM